MSQENRLWPTLYSEQTNFYGSKEIDAFTKELEEATGAQVPSVLDSTSAEIDQRVKRYNEQLANLRE